MPFVANLRAGGHADTGQIRIPPVRGEGPGLRPGGGPVHESEPDRELEQVRVLVEAVVALTSAFAPGMVERGRGGILNVASTAGMQPMPYSAGYAAAKAYVLSFSEALHQELRGHGV